MTFSNDPARRRYTPEEYLAAEACAEFKSEYHDGEVFAMVGASEAHVTISMNLAGLLHAQLRGKPCRAYNADMKVSLDAGAKFYYPDLSVVCGQPVYHDAKKTILANPSAVIEVLSDSTEAFDRGKKFAAYARLPSLTDYVLVGQDEPRMERFSREGDRWSYEAAYGLAGFLDVRTIGCRFALEEVYDRIEFASQTLEPAP